MLRAPFPHIISAVAVARCKYRSVPERFVVPPATPLPTGHFDVLANRLVLNLPPIEDAIGNAGTADGAEARLQASQGVKFFYTLDGSEPTATSAYCESDAAGTPAFVDVSSQPRVVRVVALRSSLFCSQTANFPL